VPDAVNQLSHHVLLQVGQIRKKMSGQDSETPPGKW